MPSVYNFIKMTDRTCYKEYRHIPPSSNLNRLLKTETHGAHSNPLAGPTTQEHQSLPQCHTRSVPACRNRNPKMRKTKQEQNRKVYHQKVKTSQVSFAQKPRQTAPSPRGGRKRRELCLQTSSVNNLPVHTTGNTMAQQKLFRQQPQHLPQPPPLK